MLEIILIIISLLVLFLKSLVIDRLIKYQYEMHYDQWEAAGKPCGYFWHPKERPYGAGHFARKNRLESWLFSTPQWAKNDRFPVSMIWLDRALTVVLVATCFSLAIFFIS